MDLIQFNKVNQELSLFSEDEAINLGNLFKNLYMSYNGFSNYCYHAMNERQKLLFEIQKYNFCAHELTLYLDVNRTSRQLCELRDNFINKSKKLTQKFEEQYGPLSPSHAYCKDGFNWVKGPWPWENL